MVGNEGKGVGEESEEEEEGDLCVICLMKVDDRTVVGDCGHSIFCVSQLDPISRCSPSVLSSLEFDRYMNH